jgi:hypothetical protein
MTSSPESGYSPYFESFFVRNFCRKFIFAGFKFPPPLRHVKKLKQNLNFFRPKILKEKVCFLALAAWRSGIAAASGTYLSFEFKTRQGVSLVKQIIAMLLCKYYMHCLLN